jgi:SAM-dependent methyltransferase
MESNQPHLIVADAENLPFANGVFDAVLGFDAFHHIPDRPLAMRQFARVMKDRGRVVLVEPGGDHEHYPSAKEVMEKYGTIEIGMELADVQNYIKGIKEFGACVEIFTLPVSSADPRNEIPMSVARDRSFIGWCLYSIEKVPPDVTGRAMSATSESHAPSKGGSELPTLRTGWLRRLYSRYRGLGIRDDRKPWRRVVEAAAYCSQPFSIGAKIADKSSRFLAQLHPPSPDFLPQGLEGVATDGRREVA